VGAFSEHASPPLIVQSCYTPIHLGEDEQELGVVDGTVEVTFAGCGVRALVVTF
jgi:hypothetical protein